MLRGRRWLLYRGPRVQRDARCENEAARIGKSRSKAGSALDRTAVQAQMCELAQIFNHDQRRLCRVVRRILFEILQRRACLIARAERGPVGPDHPSHRQGERLREQQYAGLVPPIEPTEVP